MGRKKKVVEDVKVVSKGVSTECTGENKKVIKSANITKEVKVSEDVVAGDISTECTNDEFVVKSVRRGCRGRPKKLKVEKLSTECVNALSSKARTFKFLGYCSNSICNGFLSDGDLVDKDLVKCIRCGVVQKISSLLLEKKTDKEIFDNTRNVDIGYEVEDYSDSLPVDFSDLASNYKDDWD